MPHWRKLRGLDALKVHPFDALILDRIQIRFPVTGRDHYAQWLFIAFTGGVISDLDYVHLREYISTPQAQTGRTMKKKLLTLLVGGYVVFVAFVSYSVVFRGHKREVQHPIKRVIVLNEDHVIVVDNKDQSRSYNVRPIWVNQAPNGPTAYIRESYDWKGNRTVHLLVIWIDVSADESTVMDLRFGFVGISHKEAHEQNRVPRVCSQASA
jgi:hypothetical protein